MNKKLLIIAGEESGDLHGSELIKELKSIDQNIDFFGIGGDKMISAGLQAKYHINEMSFLGFAEVVKHLPFIRKVKKNMVQLSIDEKINNIVLIDYPGFNLSIAKSFYKLGKKNIYYISPQIWAWGKKRIIKIKRLIKRMIVFFPFEKEMYDENKVKSNFVGHPLVKKIEHYKFLNKVDLKTKHNLDLNREILLLLPGSRKQELDKILADVLPATTKLSDKFNLQIVIACADNIDENYFSLLSNKYNFNVVKGDTYNLLKNSKFAIVKSGTSTLEAGIIGTPFIVIYKTSFFTYLIGKILIKINNIALANIVAGKTVVPELIQQNVNPNKIFVECSKILSDQDNYMKLKSELSKIKLNLFTEGNPCKKAAEIIYSELNELETN